MARVSLILGGARSGKSARALALAGAFFSKFCSFTIAQKF